MFFLRVHSVDTNHPVSLEDAEFTTIHTAKAAAAPSNPRFSERRGIAHLFRRRRGSSSSLPSHGAESSLLFVVAVPNYLSFNNFIRFCEPRLGHVAELVFIRNDAMEDRYSVVVTQLVRLMNEMKADEFHGSFHGKRPRCAIYCFWLWWTTQSQLKWLGLLLMNAPNCLVTCLP